MTATRKFLLAALLALVLLTLALFFFRHKRLPSLTPAVTLEGSVLRQNPDPDKQTPLAEVIVTASDGSAVASTKTNALGLFNLTLNRGLSINEPVTLTFRHPDYKPLQITADHPGDQLYIARLQPLAAPAPASGRHSGAAARLIQVSNVRVRYTSKQESTVSVGSFAKQFSAKNTGNVPCNNHQPCSPDGKWKASLTSLPIDAGEGNEFLNLRVSCIAGPCAFSKIQTEDLTRPQRKFNISVLNWSDTTDFLVEADVERTMVTDAVQYSYPFQVGETMTFTLPASTEGPSVEAELNQQYIVFPLGPDVILSIATCDVDPSSDGNKTYRCQLKPGYEFQ